MKKEQKCALYNVDMFYQARNSVIDFFDDYTSMISVAKYKAIHGEGIKILTLKERLQRLPK